ncbi:receptor-like protein 39 [Ziziphus jujuba]|uniref:Receptor-like protein 39 n=1 Tax=Ziziphus jujuba TaxID=326968 RepID=A0ABM4AC42_ZIZJJ|nr:receptor-like protein 39 [Ziziphus jujuba]
MAIPLPVSWLLFLFSIYSSLFFFGHHVVVVVGGTGQNCLSHQQSLLLQLKHTLTFNTTTSKILVHWNQSSDCCNWPGISCDHEGRVTGLKLSNESISGGIDNNSTLFNLAYLQILDLSLNDLNSTIPSRIGNLTNLSYLNFSNSGFMGQIPKQISRLSKLVNLDLCSYSVYYDFGEMYETYNPSPLQIPNLGMLVGNMTKLEEVYLDGVNISAPGNEWGMARLSSSSLPHLRVLSLRDCYLSGPIPRSLAKLKSLSIIRLDDNYDLSSRVPEFFANFSNLTSLSLGACNLSGTFPKEIFQVQTLRTLELSFNDLLQVSLSELPMDSHLQSLVISGTNSSGGRLPASIGNLVRLSTLDVSGCGFSGPLPNSITNLTQLVHLGLSRNYFNGTFPDSITKLTQLVDLDLSSNNFNGTFPDSIAKLTQIVYLDLSSNNFIGPIPSFHMFKNLTGIDLSSNRFIGPIPSTQWEGLLHLVYVDLMNNSLNGNIPSSLFALPSVDFIDLSYNEFSGQLLEFPNASSSVLRCIDLGSNKLQGTIPMSIFKLRNLEYLILSSNKFNSTIELDNMIHDFSNLYYLDLSYNDLLLFVGSSGDNNSNFSYFPQLNYLNLASCKLGVFPDQIKNLPQLSGLDLSNNQIYGEIPSWVWKVGGGPYTALNLSRNQLVGMQEPYSLYNVSSLDLSFNRFQGKIPILPLYADHIDLSSNNFTSSIPSDIGLNLSYTSYLSLSNNSLTGVIPKSICNASDLQVLDLSNNTLNGKIPRCIIAMNQTILVSLRGNNLKGPIPDAFPFYCSLKTLDLNGNLLTDRIPKSLGNCSALELLNLGNNQMVDSFPLLLKNISTLRVLILRSNKLHGCITCPNGIGDWPAIQIVNVASNNFSGELPFQCLSKWHAMMAVGDGGQSQLRDPSVVTEAMPPASANFKDAVTVTNKRLEMELIKIPQGFTCIDFSSNNFNGKIPKELGQLEALMVLNLSNNALSGHIPSSFGKLKQLESLDLSRNYLNGEIPASLSNLNFLQVLDLSHNRLSGRIPKGTQIQTFSADCFEENDGLCGPPLTPNCSNDVANVLPKTPPEARHSNSGTEIRWDLIGAEVGFVVGFGIVNGPLVFSRRWRKWYYDHVEDIAFKILPQLLLKKWLSWKMRIRK